MAFEAAVPDATPLVTLLEGPAEPDPVAMTDVDELEGRRFAGIDVVEVVPEKVAVTLAVKVSVSAFYIMILPLAIALIMLKRNLMS